MIEVQEVGQCQGYASLGGVLMENDDMGGVLMENDYMGGVPSLPSSSRHMRYHNH